MDCWSPKNCLVAGGLLLAAMLQPAGAGAASLESYGGLPSVDEMQISPDATKYAFVTDGLGRRLIVIQDLKTGKPTKLLNIGANKVRNLRWAGNEHLLITTSTATVIGGLSGPMREYFSVNDYFVTNDTQTALLSNDVAAEPQVRTIDGKIVAFVEGVYFPDRESQLGLFKVELDDHYRTSIVDRGTQATRHWAVDVDGTVVARDEFYENGRQWALDLKIGEGWVVRRTAAAPIDSPVLVGMDSTGDGVLVAAPEADGEHLLRFPKDPAQPETDMATSLEGVLEDPQTGRAIATVGGGYHFFDPLDQRRWAAIEKAYDKEVLRFVSRSADGKTIIVKVEGPRDGVAYAYVDLGTHQASAIADIYAGIKPEDLAPVQRIAYPAADGLTIPAYLTLPRDRPGRKLPLVVLPHGGPAAHDEPGFDWWSQALAAQGYAVLQPEYRGSTGFGARFMEAGYGEWGRKMQSDLSDGVRKLAADGTIDPARVCIVGASYGGYAALAGAAFDPGIYRCAVSVAGPADLAKMLDYSERQQNREDNRVTRYWMRFMGAKSDDDPALAAISPALHADKVTIPMLLIHGEDDTVVQYRQSKIMQSALEDAKRPVTLVTLDSEDHWLSRAATRTQMLKATVDFLKANNPPG
jgi:dipeptidyl aminopeptidase/acylaminoacyl peptidase